MPDTAEATPAQLVLPTQPEILRELVGRRGGRRDFTPISRSFLQQRGVSGGGAAVLAKFVGSRRKRALELWLLAHTVASAPPYDVAFPSWVWASGVGMEQPDSASASVFVSKTWKWLEEIPLIRSERDGHLRRIFLLADDASGRTYALGGDYFKLPHEFWLDGYAAKLKLAGTAVLLIALSLAPDFMLPHDHASEWYGLSRDTIRRGLNELQDHELLTARRTRRRSAVSPTGMAEHRRYRLAEPFAR